jgi:hypothetical protein
MLTFFQRFPEFGVLIAMAAITLSLAGWLGAPFVIPDERIRIYLGVRYAVPVAMAGIFFALPLLVRRRRHGQGGAPSLTNELVWSAAFVGIFSAVMWLHFHIKMWVPLINPLRFDDLYQRSDLALAPLVAALTAFRAFVNERFPVVDHWYLGLFMGMFFISFSYHMLWDRRGFRRVYLATLVNQSLGALSYLIAPAVGPFLYAGGPNRLATASQTGMWEAYNTLIANGPVWLESFGQSYFNAGLAAMPSLHAGAAWVFVWYAFAHRTRLKWFYVIAYGWILIEAVVSKWHYVIDLPAGIILAALSIWIANRLLAKDGAEKSAGPQI